MHKDITAINRHRIASWLREPPNVALIGLMLFAIALRLYYFNLTKNQPLWWDEAEYMLKAKSIVFGTPETGWDRASPVLLSFLAAALLQIGLGEVTIRLLWVSLSTASLILVYRIGTMLFNKRVGLYALALGSVFYIDLFYTSRLLVDVPQVFFVVLAAYLLVSSLVHPEATKRVWAIVPILILGTVMRFTVGIFLPVVAVFLLAVKGKTVLKEKEWHISLALGFVAFLPFMLYFWKLYGNPIYPIISQGALRAAFSTNPSSAEGGGAPSQVFLEYVRFFPTYTNVIVVSVFLGGMIQAIAFTARHTDQIRQNQSVQGYVLLLLWTVVPFLFFGLFVNHFEDRYLAMIFPAVFILTGAALDRARFFLKRLGPAAAAAAVAGVVLYGGSAMAFRSEAVIRRALLSYDGVRDAGLWIREHTRPGDTVISSSVPQNTYYSERATLAYPRRESDFERLVQDRKPKYLVLSLWEKSPEWAYAWPKKHPEKASLAAAFFRDQAAGRPTVFVYALDGAERRR